MLTLQALYNTTYFKDLIVFYNGAAQLCLSFYEVKNNKAIWFSNKVERLYWEQWYINLNVAQHHKPTSSKSHYSKVIDSGIVIVCVCDCAMLLETCYL